MNKDWINLINKLDQNGFYKEADALEGKEYVIKKDASFAAGDQTEVLTLEDIDNMSQEDIDLGSLFEGQDLSEEFKNKATTIFEAAVAARVTQEIERVTEELIEANNEEVASFKEGLIDKIDGYLGYISEQWLQKNELALERGIKADLFESLVTSMKTVFEEHYITVPEEQFDVLEDVKMFLKQEGSDLRFYLWETIGIAIGNINGVVRGKLTH